MGHREAFARRARVRIGVMTRPSILIASLAGVAVIGTAVHARADTDTQMAAKVIQLVEFAAGVIDANENDCNAMGEKLSRMANDNSAFIDHVKARAEKATPAELRALTAPYQARFQAAMAKAKPGLDRCQSNPKVASVLRKVEQ